MMHNVPVAGIDIGKYFSEMAILSPSNNVYARMKINHNEIDFKKAYQLLQKAEKEFEAKPVIVMEATGHYFKLLFYHLKNTGYEVIVTNPIQTDCIKNIGVRKVKNDKVDAKKVAILYRLGELKPSIIPEDNILNLRSLCRQYYDLVDERTTYKNRLRSIVDQLMLHFGSVFKDIYSNTSLAILEKHPTPDDILKADRMEMILLMSKTARKSLSWATKKYELLYTNAENFKSISISSVANVTMLKSYILIIKALNQSIDEVLKSLKALVLDSNEHSETAFYVKLLCSIPGIEFITAATIIAEIGDFYAFSNPNKLVAFFGIDPSVNQSGQFNGSQNHISKRGSRLLRRVLYTAALVNITEKSNGMKNNPVLLEYYKTKCLNKAKPVALVAVMRKLVFIIFAVLRDLKPFEFRTPEEHAKKLNAKALQLCKKSA